MSRPARAVGLPPREASVVPALYRALRERIVTTALAPGEAVSELRVAESYGVSRTPVREAFKRLAEEGFLEVVPQVGSFVARIDLRMVRDSHFVRETLECRIVELAAARIDATGRAALTADLAAQRRAIAADDRAGFFEADEAMHARFAAIAGHASVWQVIHAAKAQLDRVRHLSLASRARSRLRLTEHRAIAGHVMAGDSGAAVQAMRAHLASVFDAIESIAAVHAHYFVDSAVPPQPGDRPP